MVRFRSAILIAIILLAAPGAIALSAGHPAGCPAGRPASAGNPRPQTTSLSLTYDFAPPVVVPAGAYHRIALANLPTLGEPGQPALPYQSARILLPPGQDVAGVEVEPVGEAVWPGRVRPAPAQPQQPLCIPPTGDTTRSTEHPTTTYPPQYHQVFSTQTLGGYRILLLRLFPVRYEPATDRLTYARQLRVTVRLRPTIHEAALPPNPTVASRVRALVDNPSHLRSPISNPRPTGPLVDPDTPYDYIIITNEALSPTFQSLVDWRTSQGLAARIFTTEEIYAHYDGTRPDGGTDNPTRIRNFLIDAYTAWLTTPHPLRYVLLGGDVEIIPPRYVSVLAGIYSSDELICDNYYAGLDGTWDDDADGYYGEGDATGGGTGEAGEEADFYAELYVGRAPVSSAAQAANFINKIIAYESDPAAAYLDEGLMLGEQLDSRTYAGYSVDEIAALAPALDVTRLYDRNATWDASDLIPRLNGGVHIVNHLGHAYYGMVMRMTRAQVDNLTNEEPFLVHTQGCLAAKFDEDDAVGEHFVFGEHGAFAFIGNTQYGWYLPGSTNGASQLFHLAFIDALFNERIHPVGQALQYAKEISLDRVGPAGPERWVCLELVLLGDPATPVVTDYEDPVAHIASPPGGFPVAGRVPLAGSAHAGTANGATFASYRLDYGSGTNPATWTQIGVTATTPLTAGPLGTWDTGLLPDGKYTLRLTAADGTGLTSADQIVVSVDHADITAPAAGEFLGGGAVVTVTGTATRGDFQDYAVQVGAGANPDRWTPVLTATTPVTAGTLALWDTGAITEAGRYTLRLLVHGTDYIGSDAATVVVDPLYQAGWPRDVEQRISESAIAVGDLDGNGDMEVVAVEGMYNCGGALEGGRCGAYGMRVYAWHHDGSLVDGWPRMPGSDNRLTTPTLADLDADGDLEVIVGSIDGRVYVYEHDGASAAGWPQTTDDAIYATPAAADLDEDGDLEVVACSRDGQTYAWHHDGSLVSGWPRPTDACDASPLLVNLDGDGEREVVVAGRTGRVSAFRPDGSPMSGWPITVSGKFVASPAAGDLDGDGVPEIVAAAEDAVYVWRPDGTPAPGWPQTGLAGDIVSSPALADLDGDGSLEIILAGGSQVVYAWHYDGTPVDGWGNAKAPVVRSSPVVGDIDGDGDLEVLLAGGDDDGGIYAWHSDGTPVEDWPRSIPTRDAPWPDWDRRCSPVLVDVDGDGDLEVGLGVETKVFFWDTPGPFDRAPWPTFQADPARSGAFACLTPTVQAVHVFTDGLSAAFSAEVEASLPVYYLWEFGDGVTSTVPAVTHTYPAYGVYPLTLTVRDHCGTAVWCGHVNLPSPWRQFYLPVVMRDVSQISPAGGSAALKPPAQKQSPFGAEMHGLARRRVR